MDERNSYSTTALQNTDSAGYIDLRSDTITRPDAEMRQVMANAIVGDDVYVEDPTINSLERACAKLFRKEAGLFVATGTMGNLLCVLAHTQRGDEIIVGETAHIHRWEQGNYARFAGVSASTVRVLEDGTLDLDEVKRAIRIDDIHMPRSKLICIENTHTHAGGHAISLEYMHKIRRLADENNLAVHVDGARFYNAVIELGTTVAELAATADSVTMCFSKGLGAPIGSIVVGTADFIYRCRRHRKALGGGWRQGGILAAAARLALDRAPQTIRNDHENADYLCKELNAATPSEKLHSLHARRATNMVIFNVLTPYDPIELAAMFKEAGILVMPFDETRIRMVMNNSIGKKEVDKLVSAYRKYILSS